MSEQRQLSLSASADGSQIRTAMFNGKQNLVVPVVALLGNTVVRPMNSRGAEFVPEKELASSPAGWNGRPIVPDHPDGGRASANSPTVLESQAFGRVFGARYEDGRLKMEAWLDPARADKVGPLAQEVIRRCREGKMVEVSVGVWVTANQKRGSHNGSDYEYEWSQIVPDHLAMLPEGVPGACSVKMGCGAPRSLASEPEALGGAGSGNFGHSGRLGEIGGSGGDGDGGDGKLPKAKSSEKQGNGRRSWFASKKDAAKFAAIKKSAGHTVVNDDDYDPEDGPSVWVGPKGPPDAFTQAVVSGVDPASGYTPAMPKDDGYGFNANVVNYMKRTYASKREAMTKNPAKYEKLDPRAFSDGYSAMSQTETLRHVYNEAVNYEGPSRDAYIAGGFTADRDMVRTTGNGRHSPMGKMDKGTGYFDTKKKRGLSSGEGCGCSKDQGHPAPLSGVRKGVNMSGKINTLVERVLASKSNVFDEECREHLESLGEDRLAVLAEKLEAEAPAPAPVKVEEPKPLTEEEKFAALPEEVKAMASFYRERDKAEREALVTSLGKAQKVFPKEALDAKPTDELRSLAALLKIDEPVPDYSGRLQPVQRAAASAVPEAQDPWGLTKPAAN